jgi:hypothetical protein
VVAPVHAVQADRARRGPSLGCVARWTGCPGLALRPPPALGGARRQPAAGVRPVPRRASQARQPGRMRPRGPGTRTGPRDVSGARTPPPCGTAEAGATEIVVLVSNPPGPPPGHPLNKQHQKEGRKDTARPTRAGAAARMSPPVVSPCACCAGRFARGSANGPPAPPAAARLPGMSDGAALYRSRRSSLGRLLSGRRSAGNFRPESGASQGRCPGPLRPSRMDFSPLRPAAYRVRGKQSGAAPRHVGAGKRPPKDAVFSPLHSPLSPYSPDCGLRKGETTSNRGTTRTHGAGCVQPSSCRSPHCVSRAVCRAPQDLTRHPPRRPVVMPARRTLPRAGNPGRCSRGMLRALAGDCRRYSCRAISEDIQPIHVPTQPPWERAEVFPWIVLCCRG